MLDNQKSSLLPSNNYSKENKDKSKIKSVLLISISFLSVILIIFIIASNGDKIKRLISYEEDEWNWKPEGDRIKTKWTTDLDPKKVWQEYPRQHMKRKEWLNLNGAWSYAITDSDSKKPEKFDGKILVPFPLESSLSGVMKTIKNNQALWYEKIFEIPESWMKKNIFLNFGAVDWKCVLFINDAEVGEHSGGYSPFSFNITKYITKGNNTILLKVVDPTNRGVQPVGKQTINPGSIWYTPISGIWQTVWLEPFDEFYIEKIEINNDFDKKEMKLTFKLNVDVRKPLLVTIEYNKTKLADLLVYSKEEIVFKIPDEHFHPWSPSEPNLYDISTNLYGKTGSLLDTVISYTAMRKIEQKKDESGFYRIFLNNKPIFNMGTLDQGYWPEGLYTPPSQEAMISDIQTLKNLGFNTIRKHIKVEPLNYYYYCDKLGMLIWQDMPSGDVGGNKWAPEEINGGTDVERSDESKEIYYKEWAEIIDKLKFFQSIIVWVPFNEAWGQFETEKVVEFTKEQDPLRLINAASGGNHRICGNFLDIHSYPNPNQSLKEESLITVIGEYGGLGLDISGHTWKEDNWGYVVLKSKEEITERYEEYINDLIKLIDTGVSGAIYTQTTDVESEINGLITYDREEIKVIPDRIKAANEKLINSLQ